MGSSLTRTGGVDVPASFPFPLSFFPPFPEVVCGTMASCRLEVELERDRVGSSSPVAEPDGSASTTMGCAPEPEANSVLDVGSVGSAVAVWFLAEARCARPVALLAWKGISGQGPEWYVVEFVENV